jgi:hypothetical protein
MHRLESSRPNRPVSRKKAARERRFLFAVLHGGECQYSPTFTPIGGASSRVHRSPAQWRKRAHTARFSRSGRPTGTDGQRRHLMEIPRYRGISSAVRFSTRWSISESDPCCRSWPGTFFGNEVEMRMFDFSPPRAKSLANSDPEMQGFEDTMNAFVVSRLVIAVPSLQVKSSVHAIDVRSGQIVQDGRRRASSSPNWPAAPSMEETPDQKFRVNLVCAIRLPRRSSAIVPKLGNLRKTIVPKLGTFDGIRKTYARTRWWCPNTARN